MSARDHAVLDLAGVLPAGGVSTAPADLLAASGDLWPRHILRLWQGRTPELPAAVVWPEDVAGVQRLVAFARARGIALVPYGAGSSVVGGATAGAGAVVIDLKRMDRLVGVDVEGRTATAEAGIMGELLERALGVAGFTTGHFPSSIYCSTLGGWIAARGAGQMSSRYGKIEDQVAGGVVVLGDGSVVRQAATPVRARLFDALIGAEGTLGVWTEATVRVHPLPAHRSFRALDFASLGRALAAAEAWLRAGLAPAVVRIYDPVDTLLHRHTSAEHGRGDRGPSRVAWVGARWPRLLGALADRLGGRSRVIVGLQGAVTDVERDLELVREIAAAHQGDDLGAGPGEAWWRTRYRVSYRQSNALRAGVAVDTMEVACTWDRALPVYEAVRRAGRAAGAQVLAHFSHVYLEGVSIYFTYALPAAAGEAGYDRLWERCLEAAIACGGNVSHHHGVGRLKAAAFRRVLGGALTLLHARGAALDPDGILNPDVLARRAAPDCVPPVQGAEAPPAQGAEAPLAQGAEAPLVRGAEAPLAQGAEAPLVRGAEAPPMRGAEVPPVQGAEALPVRGAESPGAAFTTAVAHETLAEIEARLAPRGLTLGAVAALLPGWTAIELGRRGWLWRKSPQIRVLEPALMGVDGRVAGRVVRYVPAPRAAMGSELWPQLLEAEVERLWLRATPASAAPLYLTGSWRALLERARTISRDEDLGGTLACVRLDGGRAVLRLDVMDGPLAPARLTALARGGDGVALDAAPELEPHSPLAGEPVAFAGPWSQVLPLVEAAVGEGHEVAVALADALGALGWLVGASGVSREALHAFVERHDAGSRLTRTSPEAAAAKRGGGEAGRPGRVRAAGGDASSSSSSSSSSEPRRGRLVLAGASAELDNCTYCPKLCRFACPVAVADGSETLTPRQLMLTAALDRRGARPLGPDEALRLYACADCRGCRTFCDHDNDVARVLMQARAELHEDGAAPRPVVGLLQALARDGRPPAADSGRAVVLGDGPEAGAWLFFGCQNAAGDEGVMSASLALARRRLGAVHVPRLELSCCGHPLWRWGDRNGFVRHARAFAAQLRGASCVVVDDPGCAYALRHLYPAAGVRVPAVVTATSLLAGVEIAAPDAALYAPHDDEWATRYLGEPTLRELLRLPLGPGSVLEGESGSCGGMLLPRYDPALADRVARTCVADLLRGGAERIVTASPTCRARLRAAGAPVVGAVELWARGAGCFR